MHQYMDNTISHNLPEWSQLWRLPLEWSLKCIMGPLQRWNRYSLKHNILMRTKAGFPVE